MTTAQAEANVQHRGLRNVMLALDVIPWLTIVAIYLLAVRSWIVFDVWPLPYRPDPKDVSAIHHGLALLGVVASFGGSLGLLFGLLGRSGDRSVVTIAAVGLVGTLALWLVMGTEIGSWLLD